MKLLITGLLLICSFCAFASTKVYGEGRFYANDEDSLEFLKKQLLFSAFQDVLTKEFKAMGLDDQIFWQKFDEKFEAYFNPMMEELKKKYGVVEEGEGDAANQEQVDSKKLEAYKKALRYKKLAQKSAFGKLSRLITSYSILKMSRSTQYPNSRYIKIQAKIDRKMVHRLYTKFTQEQEARRFETLYLTVDFQLNGMSWSDVGVDIGSNFTTVVVEYWKRWINEKMKSYVDSVVVTEDDLAKKLNDYTKLHQATPGGANLMTQTEGEDWSKDALWLKVNVLMGKEGEDVLLQSKNFSFDGEFLLVDLKLNNVLSHFDFPREIKTYPCDDAHMLSSNVASFVYRMPLDEFEKMKRKLSNVGSNIYRTVLEIQNVASVQDLFALDELLQMKGITLQITSQIQSYSGKSAQMMVSYSRGQEYLIPILRSLNRAGLNTNRIIDLKDLERPFTIVLQDTEQMQEGSDGHKSKDDL